MSNQIRFKIGGMEYAVTSDDDALYIKSLAAELDRKITALSHKNRFLSTTMVAVLAALEAYDAAKKQAIENEKLRLEIKTLLEESACARLEADRAKRKLQEILGSDEDEDAQY